MDDQHLENEDKQGNKYMAEKNFCPKTYNEGELRGRLFSCMESHVPLQIAFELNPILAIIAHWPIFSSVNLHVTPGMRIEIFNGASVILIPIQIKHSVTSVEILHRIQSV